MKLLLLNPHFNAQHQVVQFLQKKGVAVLLATDAAEAFQMIQIHGSTLDLAVIHREGLKGNAPIGEPGSDLIAKIKKTPGQEDLPTLFSSETWGDPQFAAHQKTPFGANAYLRYPFDELKLWELIAAVVGDGSQAAASSAPPPPSSGTSPAMVLEDAAGVFGKSDSSRNTGSIQLELPDVEKTDDAPSSVPESVIERVSDSSPAEINLSAKSDGPSGGISISSAEDHSELELSPGRPQTEAPAGVDAPFAPEPPTGYDLAHQNAGPSIESPTIALSVANLHEADSIVEESLAPAPPAPSGGMSADLKAALGDALEMPVGGGEESSIASPLDEPINDLKVDSDAEQEMPYLFGGAKPKAVQQSSVQAMSFSQPLDDAVVPGGAAQTPDLETLKKYLLLREQDVGALSTQLKSSKDQIHELEETLRAERQTNSELMHQIEEQQKRINDWDQEKQAAVDGFQNEIQELKFQLKAKADKARVLEIQVRDATSDIEKLKDRVRGDIRKIRVREKELENRLEILKKDSEALIAARESKIIELKRKTDLLEFNMDLLQEAYQKERDASGKVKERLNRAAQAIRLAGGLLDSPTSSLIAALEQDQDQEKEAS